MMSRRDASRSPSIARSSALASAPHPASTTSLGLERLSREPRPRTKTGISLSHLCFLRPDSAWRQSGGGVLSPWPASWPRRRRAADRPRPSLGPFLNRDTRCARPLYARVRAWSAREGHACEPDRTGRPGKGTRRRHANRAAEVGRGIALELETPKRILMSVDRTHSSHVETDPAHAASVPLPLSSRVEAAFRRLSVAAA